MDKIVEELIEKSGNNFHCKVVNYLRLNKWSVHISPYYTDIVTNKQREIDIVAEKYDFIKSDTKSTNYLLVYRLFIECKYIKSDSYNIFWMDNKDINQTIKLLSTMTNIKEDNDYNRRLHLCSIDKAAKLFMSDKGNAENEIFYKALNQTLNGMNYLNSNVIIDENLRRKPITKIFINIPVIVCSSFKNFNFIDIYNSSELPKYNEYFQIEVLYSVPNGNSYISQFSVIDVINFENIHNYELFINEDIKVLKGYDY